MLKLEKHHFVLLLSCFVLTLSVLPLAAGCGGASSGGAADATTSTSGGGGGETTTSTAGGGDGATTTTAGGGGTTTTTVPPSNPPSTPNNLRATAYSRRAAISWEASSGASSYRVYWGNSAGFTPSLASSSSTTETSYVHKGLRNGTTYYYRVAASNEAGSSAYSSSSSASPTWGFTLTTLVDDSDITGKYSRIATDRLNGVHIIHYNSTDDKLAYMQNLSDTWESGTAAIGGRVWFSTAMDIDSNDNLHVAYHKGTADSFHDLKYFTKAREQTAWTYWTEETIESVGDIGGAVDLCVDSNNKVHISYLDATNSTLKHAHNDTLSGGFTTEVVTSSYVGLNDNSDGLISSIAVTNDGTIYIAYTDTLGPGDLMLAIKAPGGSFYRTLLATAEGTAYYPSLAIDDAGGLHVAYFDNTAGDGNDGALMFSSRSEGGTWSAPAIVDANLSAGRYCDLTFDTSGTALISYHRKALSATYLDSYCLVAVKYSGDSTWTLHTIDTGDDSDNDKTGEYTSISTDNQGRLHISFFQEDNGHDLMYAVED